MAYRVSGKQFYISDFHVAKTARYSKSAYNLLMKTAVELAEHEGCEFLGMHAALAAPNLSKMLAVHLKVGFRVIGVEHNKLALVMNLSEVPAWLRAE